jgi:hypothetical protein
MSVLWCLLFWWLQVTPPGTASVNFFSIEQDIEIGTESSTEAEETLPIVRSAALNRYITSLSDRLVHSSSIPSALRFRFRIVNSREINSQAFPGGPVYMNRGLVEQAGTEDELAALMAHEIAHIVSRHATSQLSRQLLVQAPLSIAAGLPTNDGWKEQLQRLGVTFGVRASFLRYSREQELEACLMAVQILAAGRFDPRALQAIFRKIVEAERLEGVVFPLFAYNHPMPETRWTDVDAEIGRLDLPRTNGVALRSEFRTFQTGLSRVAEPVVNIETPLPAPNEIVPNVHAHPQDFYRLYYPDGWEVTRISSNGAIIAPADGIQSSRAGDDITHGVMLDVFDLSDRPLPLDEATDRLIVYLRQNNQDLRVVPGAQIPILANNEPGLRTVMIGESPATRSREIIWVVTRMYYQNLFYMVFVAPENEFAEYQPRFEEMIRSLQFR